jgi:hypothetical protein
MKSMQIDHFDKYAFVKAFVNSAKTESQKKEKEKEALIIAEVFEKNEKRQQALLDNVATKGDLINMVTKQDLDQKLIILEQKLIIKLSVIMAALLTVLPLLTEFVKRSF